ncbi:UTP--glucose-1-phosphate uridylyltransferase 3, chloroplastic isoform X2 [Salvia miltiorrhiza]|uniref:UTP--glucose-1-phosphate uridylyltransferase 3, chloroplastic isoform X2 n=1 Tax=Salvia miltiorrhiza TaxID=226208 RepID=UPI0025AD0563|nr:UTP--glucose-1-phosphate uridylyltransferase 3, chloroplastic isoform X2 [Salvia miltiorrhiza]
MARTNYSVLRHNNPLFAFNSRPSNSLFFSKYFSRQSNYFLSSSIFSSPNQLHLLTQSPSSCASITRVSTAPVEYAPPPDLSFYKEIARLKGLREALSGCRTLTEKLRTIDSDSRVKSFLKSWRNQFAGVNLSDYELFMLKCVAAAGQEHVLGEFGRELESGELELRMSSLKSALYALAETIENWDGNGGARSRALYEEDRAALWSLLKMLGEVEQFYNCIGGIIGYQISVLELLAQSTQEGHTPHTTHWNGQTAKSLRCQFVEIHPPSVLDLSEDTEYASQAAFWGIQGLPDLGEIYPLGGSADRLGLVDPETGECLPAAMLPYCGRTLLEGLIRDLQAREFLYFKLYEKQCITPVAIMTSSAKNNHEHITHLCERLGWFGRGRSNFQLFEQPLVPTIAAEDGHWIAKRPLEPVCKPGGHGVIWKLAHDKGIFKWFRSHARKGATVRQISNVVAATDITLLALAGIGLHHGKKLGFASCKRNPGATEGINVLLEKKNLDDKWAYGFSCIEYTEFEKFGITVDSHSPNSLQAEFPANTNILYVDLASAELIGSSTDESSLPGMVLNIKKSITYMDQFGIKHCVPGGRLECTMQNIADHFSNRYSSRCYKGVEDDLDTFIVYNERRKVTSSAKKKRRHADKSLHQTPDGALLDMMRNAYDLLSRCGVTIPEVEDNEMYVDCGPPYLILLHPALGPLWEVIRQKFVGGSIAKGSELQIEVAEFLWRNVQLNGSLVILAENIVGSTASEIGEALLQYGRRCARCKLENIKVLNGGINWNSGDNSYWKHDMQRFEALKVILHGNAEFEARDVVIQGNYTFDVPDGHRMQITPGVTGLDIQLKPIEAELMDSGTWFWNYETRGRHIELELIEL